MMTNRTTSPNATRIHSWGMRHGRRRISSTNHKVPTSRITKAISTNVIPVNRRFTQWHTRIGYERVSKAILKHFNCIMETLTYFNAVCFLVQRVRGASTCRGSKKRFDLGRQSSLPNMNLRFKENPNSVGSCPVCEVGKLQQAGVAQPYPCIVSYKFL